MKHVLVLEVSNVGEEQLQNGLGKAFNDFCQTYKGSGITASVLTDDAAKRIKEFIEE